MTLDNDLINDLLSYIENIRAQENLSLLGVIDYPYMKGEVRSKLHRELHKLSIPEIIKDRKEISLEGLAGVLQGG